MKNAILVILLLLALSACATTKQTANTEPSLEEIMAVDTLAEVMPTFQGGNKVLFYEWAQREFQFPREVVDTHIAHSKRNFTANVSATFVVEMDGTIKDVAILSSSSIALGREVRRTILRSPVWTPGRNENGEAVRVRFVIPPIVFRIEGVTTDFYNRPYGAPRPYGR